MSNGWEWEDFEQALNKTANDPDSGGYDYNEDGTVGIDDWGAYQLDQQQGISESAVSGLGGFAEEGWSPGALVPGIPSIGSLPGADPVANFTVPGIPSIGSLPGADPVANFTVPGMPGIGSLPGADYDPMDNLDVSDGAPEPPPQTEDEGLVDLWGGIDPADAAAAGTFTGDISQDDLDSMAYLYGEGITPPGYEKIFGEIERDPFRTDWSEGRFRPFGYDIDLEDPKYDAYEPARQFLSDLWGQAEAAGFDSIESYLLDLDVAGDPDYERMRDLYNYHADIYEDLAPAYQRAQQDAFQESLRGQGIQDWLDSTEGSGWMTGALGLFATKMGIDPANIDPGIIELLVDAATSGQLAAFIDAYGPEGGETFASLFSEQVNLMAAHMEMTVSEVMANPGLLNQIGNSVNASMATTTGDGGGGDLGGGDLGGGDLGGGDGGTVSGDQTFGEWDFANNNTFAPTANMSPTDNVAGGYYGSNFLNTPDYDISSDVVSGQGNIMGYWGEGGSASDLSNIEVGEITQSLIDISSASSSAYGNSETVGTVEYPAFLVNAANGQNPELMRISGGDPFAWWESLSGNSKSMFMNRYGDEVVSMNDATSDVYRRNANGEITDFLMPEWMALQLGEAGKGLDHKAWSHLSAKERKDLQEKASIDDNLSTDLISIISNVNTDNPTIAQFDTAAGEGFIFEDINEMPEGGATSRQPQQIEEMTYGQFMQTMLANGMDFSGYSGKDANMPMSDGFAYEVSAMAQLGDAHHRGYKPAGTGAQQGVNWTLEKGKEGDYLTAHGSFVSPEMVAYFADHIDEYMTLMGLDPHSGVLSEAVQGAGSDTTFGSAYRLVKDKDEDGKVIPGSFTKEAIDNMGMSALDRMITGSSMDSYVDDVRYGGDIDDAQAINWAEFIGGTDRARDIWDKVSDLEEGKSWGGIQSDDNYSNPEIYSGGPGAGHGGGRLTEINPDDPYERYSVRWVMEDHWDEGNYSMIMDQEFGGGYNALNEISMQITPLYQAYKNWVSDQNAKPISVTSKEDWWDIYTGAQPQGAYDETPQEKINRMEGQNAGAEQAWSSYLAGIDTSNTDDLAYYYDLWSDANQDSLGYTESHYNYASGGTVQSHASNGLGHYFGGGYVDGSSGGMDDRVPAVTDGMEPAKLSSGEFVIPADVVSHLGDGNNDNGASKLHDMMNRIRTFKTGNAQQPAPVDDTWVMPS